MENSLFILDLGIPIENEFGNSNPLLVRNSWQCVCTNNCHGDSCPPGPTGG